MRRKITKISRLSPNEEAQLVQEELHRRRKLRLQQVREQERHIASQVRREVQERKEKLLRNLEATLRDEWQSHREQKIRTLEKIYEGTLRDVGQGHRDAEKKEPDRDALALKREGDEGRAVERHHEALRELVTQRRSEAERRNGPREARRKALRTEKERSVKVSGLPQPAPDPIESVVIGTALPTKATEVARFSVTHHHMTEATAGRGAEFEQAGARQAAALEAERLAGLGRETERDRLEQLERARLRGDHALRKEKVIQDRARLLCELGRLQQADLQRRGHMVSSVPVQMFQPLHRQDDLRAEQQRELEMAFQDLCTEDRELRGDLTLQLESEPLPLPAPSAASPAESGHDGDLDVTLDAGTTPCDEAEAAPGPARADITGRSALMTLLDRIRAQRDQWSRREPPQNRGRVLTESPAVDHEWQQVSGVGEDSAHTVTLETGSKVSEGSIQTDAIKQPEEHRTEVDRQVTDDDPERQREEQLALLEELREKQRRLEVELEAAQLHRQRLEQSGARTVPEPPPEPAPEVKPTAVVSDASHTARLQQYQQRLLQQNRIHKKSLEDGFRRLEEYKRALKSRYAVPTETPPSPPAPDESPLTPRDPESPEPPAPGPDRLSPDPTRGPPGRPYSPEPPPSLGSASSPRLPAPSAVLQLLLRNRSRPPHTPPEDGAGEQMRTQRDLLLSLLRPECPHTDTCQDESSSLETPDPHLKSNAPHPASTSQPNTNGPCDLVKEPLPCPPRTFRFVLQDLQQHKLSTIQEVDTPANMTLDAGNEPHPEDSDYSCGVSLTPPVEGSGSSRGSGSGRLSWREMLHLETSALRVEEHGHPDLSLISKYSTEEVALPRNGVSGRPDCHTSTTLSTGSYSSSDPHDPSCTITDSSSISDRSGTSCAHGRPGPGVSSPQGIIQKYTEEMDRSLRSVLSGGTENRPEIHDETGTFAPLQLESSLAQCPLVDRNASETTMQDVFESLCPETTNNDTAECPAAFGTPGNPEGNAADPDTPGSDGRSFHLPAFSFSTDEPSASGPAGFPKWEWVLRSESGASVWDSARSFCSEARGVRLGHMSD